MRHYYLCGHTGSSNRGCDAIVRSTAGILRQIGGADMTLMSFAAQQDRRLRLDDVVDVRPYPQKPLPVRAAGYAMRRFFGNGVWGQRCLYTDLMKQAAPEDMILNIGGDTYCYDKPYLSYALNEVAAEHGIPTVFWGCSVDESLLQDRQMQEDISRYAHIVTREPLSYEILRQCAADPDRVHLACDPAFTLTPEAVPLPAGFQPGNTVGINLSPFVVHSAQSGTDMMYENVLVLMDYILENSDMSICLVPHVYDEAQYPEDLKVLVPLYQKYAGNERVSLVRGDLNSAQLKSVISRCRFFIGARTHSMIAAYSSHVPALALSYSIKSLGIAQDLFGTYDSYAISWKHFTHPTQLRDAFIKTLQENENQILERYRQVMPEYKTRILNVSKEIFGQ